MAGEQQCLRDPEALQLSGERGAGHEDVLVGRTAGNPSLIAKLPPLAWLRPLFYFVQEHSGSHDEILVYPLDLLRLFGKFLVGEKSISRFPGRFTLRLCVATGVGNLGGGRIVAKRLRLSADVVIFCHNVSFPECAGHPTPRYSSVGMERNECAETCTVQKSA